MAEKYIKNIDNQNNTYLGRLVTQGTYYKIQSIEEIAMINNDTLLTHIGEGKAQIAKANDGTQDITSVNDQINYLKNKDIAKDSEGAILSRGKLAPSGWHLQNLYVTIETSSGVIKCKDKHNNDLQYFSIERYDVSNQLTVIQNDVVKSLFFFQPPFDIALLGTKFYQKTIPAQSIDLWIELASHIPKAQGGEIEFLEGGLDLSFVENGNFLTIDGKAPKLIYNDTVNNSNKFEITTKHQAGDTHKIMLMIQYFKPPGV